MFLVHKQDRVLCRKQFLDLSRFIRAYVLSRPTPSMKYIICRQKEGEIYVLIDSICHES